jgi:hypothetical protein
MTTLGFYLHVIVDSCLLRSYFCAVLTREVT